MKTANHLTDPIASERPFFTRLVLRLVAIIAGCSAAFLLAYLIMLPTILLGIKLGPGLGSTAWGLGIFAGYQVYRQLCKRFKLKLRYRKGEEELYEKEENEVANSASTLYEGGSEQIIDDAALTENETLSVDENDTEPDPERVEEVKLNENEIKPTAEPISEEEETPQSEEQFHKENENFTDIKPSNDIEKKCNTTSFEYIKSCADNAPRWRITRRVKKIIIIVLSIVFAVCLFFVIRALYLPIHCKTEHNKLVRTIEGKITDGTISRNELEEALKQNKQCESWRFCKFDHSKAQQEMIDLYIQYLEDYCNNNIDKADSVARDMFDWDQTDMDQFFGFDNGNEYRHYDENKQGVDVKYYSLVATSIIQNAAEKGDVLSQYTLGNLYAGVNFSYSKDEIPMREYTMVGEYANDAKATYWWLQAAEQNHPGAMGNLGSYYLEGRGVTKNQYKGCYWIQRAANLGVPFHQRRLGDLYRDGVVEKSYHTEKRENYYWGYDDVRVYDYDTIIPKDITQAMYWWNLAAEGGDKTAKEKLQQIYE